MLIGQQELPQKIKDLRGDQSQAEFGVRFGVSRQAVDRWEKGTAIPGVKVLRELQIEKVFLITESAAIDETKGHYAHNPDYTETVPEDVARAFNNMMRR